MRVSCRQQCHHSHAASDPDLPSLACRGRNSHFWGREAACIYSGHWAGQDTSRWAEYAEIWAQAWGERKGLGKRVTINQNLWDCRQGSQVKKPVRQHLPFPSQSLNWVSHCHFTQPARSCLLVPASAGGLTHLPPLPSSHHGQESKVKQTDKVGGEQRDSWDTRERPGCPTPGTPESRHILQQRKPGSPASSWVLLSRTGLTVALLGKRREGSYFWKSALRFHRASGLATKAVPAGPSHRSGCAPCPGCEGAPRCLPRCWARTAGLKHPGRSLPCRACPVAALQPLSRPKPLLILKELFAPPPRK